MACLRVQLQIPAPWKLLKIKGKKNRQSTCALSLEQYSEQISLIESVLATLLLLAFSFTNIQDKYLEKISILMSVLKQILLPEAVYL